MPVLVFVLGLAVGSFINVLVDRLPTDESIVLGRSHCDHCHRVLSWWELIPLFSFLFLRGRCQGCGCKLSWRYPVVELLTGFLYLVTVLRFPLDIGRGGPTLGADINAGLIALMLLGLVLVLVSVFWAIFLTDLRFYLVPDWLVLAGVVAQGGRLFFRGIGSIGGIGVPWGTHLAAGLGATAFFLLLVALTRGRGMGGGDVKLACLIGLVLGWPATVVALYLAFLAGGLVALLLLVTGKRKFGQMLPFAPFLTSSAIFVLLYEDWVLSVGRVILGL